MSIASKLFVVSGLTLLASAPFYVPHPHHPSLSQRLDIQGWSGPAFGQDRQIPAGRPGPQWDDPVRNRHGDDSSAPGLPIA